MLPYQSQTQFFPQPQGNAYLINSSLEIANVPISGSVTLAFCQKENLLYLKSMQNGNPVFLAFKTEPYSQETPTSNLEERIEKLEKLLKGQKGGQFDGLL